MTEFSNDPIVKQRINILTFMSQPETCKSLLEQIKTQVAKHDKVKAEAEQARKDADARIRAIVEYMEGTNLVG
jgi:hypothetical protein